jgi:tripartite-type tricarboxylate transporter receptor subunit TctC
LSKVKNWSCSKGKAQRAFFLLWNKCWEKLCKKKSMITSVLSNGDFCENFNYAAGISATHVPYKGGGPAITDALGGQIPLSFSAFGLALPHVRSGKLNALATTGATRSALLPDVPTIAEAGNLKGYEMSIVYAVWTPAGVPAPILNKITKALDQVTASSAFKEKVVADGGEVMHINTPAESQLYFQKEMQRLSKIVKEGNIKAD